MHISKLFSVLLHTHLCSFLHFRVLTYEPFLYYIHNMIQSVSIHSLIATSQKGQNLWTWNLKKWFLCVGTLEPRRAIRRDFKKCWSRPRLFCAMSGYKTYKITKPTEYRIVWNDLGMHLLRIVTLWKDFRKIVFLKAKTVLDSGLNVNISFTFWLPRKNCILFINFYNYRAYCVNN